VQKEQNLYSADSDEEPVRPATNVTKRALTEDLNGGNSTLVERPVKRAKADEETAASSFFAEPPIPKPTPPKSKISPRTEKYLYSSSAHLQSSAPIPEEEEEDDAEKARKAELHRKWVKRIGGATIGRRWDREVTPAEEGDDDEEDEEEARPAKKGPKKGAKTGKLTPMELQVLDIKRKHMDTLLIIEVGYKFRFFGEDARVAAKQLGIVCIPGRFRYDERGLSLSFHRSSIDIGDRSFRGPSEKIRFCEFSCASITCPYEEACSCWSQGWDCSSN
jgi:DNA mismatch repair protein MSH3